MFSRDSGNAAVHEGEASGAAACDGMFFCRMLLEEIYTEPKRLDIAKSRRGQGLRAAVGAAV
jgi:hypothetical protein